MKKITIFTILILLSSVLFTACSNKNKISNNEIKIDKQKIKEAYQELNRELKNN
jgi:sensor domain CHASE-containing protein